MKKLVLFSLFLFVQNVLVAGNSVTVRTQKKLFWTVSGDNISLSETPISNVNKFEIELINDSSFSLFHTERPVVVNNKQLMVGASNQSASAFTFQKQKGNVLLSIIDSGIVYWVNDSLVLQKSSKLSQKFIVSKYNFTEYTFYSNNARCLMYLGFVFILSAIILFTFYNEKYDLVLLALGGLFLRIFMAILDPSLGIWDEQYHALVAKNLINTPFTPQLYKSSILNIHSLNWINTNVWLHKPPAFLWQIALSIKLFGASVFSVRLPSILMGTFLIKLIYDIGKKLTNNKVGFFAAFLFSINHYILESAVGVYGTDHNDISLLFWVTLSVWAWLKHENSKETKWAVLVGACSGVAVLTKWYVGLFVFLPWGISLITESKGLTVHKLKPYLLSFIISTLIWGSWKLYIAHSFPVEYAIETSLMKAHFFEAIEDHGGGWLFHLKNLVTIYRIPFALIILLTSVGALSVKQKPAILGSIAFVYILFSVAATKMTSFTIMVLPFILILIGSGIYTFLSFTFFKKIKPIFLLISFVAIGYVNFDLNKIAENHVEDKNDIIEKRVLRSEFVKQYKQWNDVLFNIEKTVFIGCPNYEAVNIMFMTNCEAAYEFYPSERDILNIQQKGYNIVNVNAFNAPEYIINNENILTKQLNTTLLIL